MRQLLICGGVNGRPKSLEWLRQAVDTRRPDGILFNGGVVDSARHHGERPNVGSNLAREDAYFLEHFLETVGNLKLFTAIIPGPFDAPLMDFLRIGMHAEIEFPSIHLVHGTIVEKEDVAICGMGGSGCVETACDDHLFSRTFVEYSLRSLGMSNRPRKILLLATPPKGSLGGEEGSSFSGDLIDSLHPSLCVVGGPMKGEAPSERRVPWSSIPAIWRKVGPFGSTGSEPATSRRISGTFAT